jgi:hypothetical protein
MGPVTHSTLRDAETSILAMVVVDSKPAGELSVLFLFLKQRIWGQGGCHQWVVKLRFHKYSMPHIPNMKINDTIKKRANELSRAFSKKEVQMAKNHKKKCSPSLAC